MSLNCFIVINLGPYALPSRSLGNACVVESGSNGGSRYSIEVERTPSCKIVVT